MRKALFLCLLLASFLTFAIPAQAETLVTLDQSEIEAASISDPVIVTFNGTLTEFTIVFSDFTESADSSNLTIIAGNNASDLAMWFSAGDTSGFYTNGGSYNLTSETFNYPEGTGDGFVGTIENITFHAGQTEYLAINGTEYYNAWGITWSSFDFVWLFKQGAASIWDGTPTITLDVSDSVVSTYNATEVLFTLLPTLISIAILMMVLKQFGGFKF